MILLQLLVVSFLLAFLAAYVVGAAMIDRKRERLHQEVERRLKRLEEGEEMDLEQEGE